MFIGWADRVYYSDNGSTAVEIAIKMAFRKYLHDKNLLAESHSEMRPHNLKVLHNHALLSFKPLIVNRNYYKFYIPKMT
jgi:4-aminobutyrate aminotransferase-like enzyme